MFQHASGMLVARRIATKKASAEGREAHRDQKRTMVARRIATKNAFFFSRSRGGSDRVIRTVNKLFDCCWYLIIIPTIFRKYLTNIS